MSTTEHDAGDGEVNANWLAFRSKVKAPDMPKRKSGTAAGRADYENHGRVRDRRSDRRTGRTVKVTIKLRPETKAKLAALAATRDTGMAEVLEAALDALEARRA
jgi:hypothetical protein